MTVSPETLMAFIDGELSFDEARRVAAEVANDPALTEYVEKHRALKARLQAVSRAQPEAPNASATPAAPAMPSQPPDSAPPAAPAPPLRQKAPIKGWVPAATMAAGIALGLLLAGSFNPSSNISSQGGMAVASGDLERILSTQLSLDQTEPNGAAQIRDSFFSKDGYFCRSFLSNGPSDTGLAGIACRHGDTWHIEALAATAPMETKTVSTDAKPAAELPASLRGAQSAMIEGDPLDADGERTARGQNWLAR